MKVYKVEVMIIDHDGVGPEGIKEALESARYPNRCINPSVMQIEGKDIGEWSDTHPLNSRKTIVTEYQRLFPKGG